MDHTDDYSQTPIPSVFVEPVQQEEPGRRERVGVSRARFAVVSLILFGALVASTTGLMMIRNAERAEWARTQQKLEVERTAALDRASRLDVANTQLNSVLAKLESGEGSAGLLLNDPGMYRDTRALLARLDSLTADFQRNPRKYINLSIF